MMHVHILGIAGTFMSALAVLAKAKGYHVTGHDEHCYPPISDLLNAQGILYTEGFEQDMESMLLADVVIVGNVMKRGMPIIELLMNAQHPYMSGPQWLAEHILKDYRVLAVAGTHGKTSTASMLAYILQEAGEDPAYLIGGVPKCLASNAHLGKGKWFVIEADEYDTAFFDKRPKFLHYRPWALIVNNLEFDHADIYPNLDAIIQQFHYLFRIVPANGFIVRPTQDLAIDAACRLGVYSPIFSIPNDYQLEALSADAGFFRLSHASSHVEIKWNLLGSHNMENGAAALIVCHQLGLDLQKSAQIIQSYQAVKRRLELCYQQHDYEVYDDFAHHPTAIKRTTLSLKNTNKYQRILAVLEFASNSMRQGHHLQAMPQALEAVDILFALDVPNLNLREISRNWPCSLRLFPNIDDLLTAILNEFQPKDVLIMMSNKGFSGLKTKLLKALPAMMEQADESR